MMELIFQSFGIIWIYATLWYILSLIVHRNDIADVAWGLGYIVLCIWFAWTRPLHPVAWLMYLLIAVWGIRLAWHIGRRLMGKSEDFRYRQWREEWGVNFYWRSYLQVYLLQGFLLVIIAMPVLVAAKAPFASLGFWSLAGAGLWVVGFLIQSIADRQLAQFVHDRKSPAEVLETGLWHYSRHPNYFGEILMWWGLFIMTIPFPGSWIGLISPLTITGLLLFVSGVPLLEKRYVNHSGYQAYKRRTSVLIPWWPRKVK